MLLFIAFIAFTSASPLLMVPLSSDVDVCKGKWFEALAHPTDPANYFIGCVKEVAVKLECKNHEEIDVCAFMKKRTKRSANQIAVLKKSSKSSSSSESSSSESLESSSIGQSSTTFSSPKTTDLDQETTVDWTSSTNYQTTNQELEATSETSSINTELEIETTESAILSTFSTSEPSSSPQTTDLDQETTIGWTSSPNYQTTNQEQEVTSETSSITTELEIETTESAILSTLSSTTSSTTSSPININFKCPTRGSGNIPHSTNCSRYFECIHGIKYLRICEEGLIFDVISSECGELNTSLCATNIQCM